MASPIRRAIRRFLHGLCFAPACAALGLAALGLAGPVSFTAPAHALFGAVNDAHDRYPFVVEIRFHGELICSGTVLFPRIVVTSAHCVQNKIYGRGGITYIDEYLKPAELSVSVIRKEARLNFKVSDVAASPIWRHGGDDIGFGDYFAHDVALIVTERPIPVGPPPSLITFTNEAMLTAKPDYHGDDRPGSTGISWVSPLDSLTDQGLLVAFGADRCFANQGCSNAGIRRFQTVSLIEIPECFTSPYTRPRPLPSGVPVWCMDSLVLPGDSGGALLVRGGDGKFYFLGVISAERGLSPELAMVSSTKRSVAAALYPSLDFITEAARRLGYLP